MTSKPNLRRLLLVAGGLLVLFILAGVIVGFFYGRTPPRPLPNPNGYDDLVTAGLAVKGNFDKIAELKDEELQALLQNNAEALRLLRLGLSRECVLPTEAAIANFNMVTRDLPLFRALGRLLVAEGNLAERENRRAAAAQSYLEAMKLGGQIGHGGLLITRLVGIACEATGNIPFAKLLPKLTCEELRPFIQQLEQIDRQTVAWSEILSNEDRFARSQMGNFPNPIKFASDLWAVREARKSAQSRHELAAARLRLLASHLALQSYQCDEGRVSTNLDQLVPKYLQQVPLDPFTGRPLLYKPTGTNWLLYSVGPDRTDNGGQAVQKKADDAKKGGDILYNSPW